jgi:2-succinyl-5-enolpyruvyl-6-hydroxy-3-cyclohexene-1-carboxylate synthase
MLHFFTHLCKDSLAKVIRKISPLRPMNTNKPGVRLIADVCRAKGIRYAVFSPGSRSAPLVMAFSQIPEIECIVIPDERVAGYFALGIAQQTQNPVVVICTSGTAVLNLGPSLCEAHYQHIPMLYLTADRPRGAEERGENQAISQADLFHKMTNGSYDIDADTEVGMDLVWTASSIAGMIDETTQSVPGPVHINVRLSEPLYSFSDVEPVTYKLPASTWARQITTSANALRDLNGQVKTAAKKLLIVGMKNHDQQFTDKLRILAQRPDVVILTETLSNASAIEGAITNYDACLDLALGENGPHFAPDIVVTLGDQIISKKLRQFLKANKPQYHWDISPYDEHRKHDIFDIPNNTAPIGESEMLDYLFAAPTMQSTFAEKWQRLYRTAQNLTAQYLQNTAFSDLKVFELLTKAFPANAHIQYGNSTPIRYSNLFRHHSSLQVNSNRGASGIDGCVSTAAGAAYATKQLTICVVGDVSFFYDSNALWNNYLSPELRIIVINNSGGNIFRLLNGPTEVNDFEKFFETRHNLSARYLAEMYGIPYYFCDHQERLEKILATFFHAHSGKPAILEIKTDGVLSAEIYKGYFEFLKSNKPT